ncbi:MAG: Holliday junction resolvase RuvX [Chloroflexota bacterium]
MSRPQGKLIGIDHGLARIGIAVCDALRISARELAIINRASRAEDFEKIAALAEQEGASGFIVGLPTNFEAAPGTYTQADTVRLWADRLQAAVGLPVKLWDEQLSSEDAAELARQQKRPFDAPIDDLAARVILQRYLDALADNLVDDPL